MAANKDNAMNMTDMTPGQQTTGTVKHTGGNNVWQAITRFIREVLIELKKTNWPTKNELTKFVIVVMFTIVVVSAYLYVSDTLIGLAATRLFDTGVVK